ncbi:hypothetical protein CSV79_14035 [Sporosarcina sp. P13]|uniref:amidohydrolase n=1 Tax=Sporosarcina sp. P13 TaxID=2048263 RepID=UPI000C168C80|nr:amidohydrolase [Sporosarcina sp. P13]PIC63016.1 hypothetical protein CSV79_14035 [Sporosarcina sp. P13]
MNTVELIIINANILTLDKQNKRARSLAVKDGRISGIWPENRPPTSEVNVTSSTEVIDLAGATLLPGFIDTHNHILSYGLMKDKVNCSTPPNRAIADIVELIDCYVKKASKGAWIEGYGYDDTLLEDHRHPTRDDLDKVSPNHPVFIRHISGHLGVANSQALQLANLTDDSSDPKGGHLGRDSNGRLNGVLYEPNAMKLVRKHIPEPTKEQMVSALGSASKDYLAQGITTNSDANAGANFGLKEIEAHIEAAVQGVNPMHTRLMVSYDNLKEGQLFGGYSAERLNQELEERSKGRVKLDSAKFFQDGSIQGMTGALRKPYNNEPSITGNLIHDQGTFQEDILALHKRGFRITTHGNGDRAIGSILDAYEYALTKHPTVDHRHRIEHLQTATTEDLDRMKNLQVAGSFFINHVYYWGDRHERLYLGPDRARRISPLKDAIDRDLLFTLHSDCPVTPISPLFSVWVAVNRITREGRVLGPEQRCDVITALKSMTIYGAILNFDEQNSGSIEVGKRADFTVLEEDPTNIDPKDIKDIKVLSTFIDGLPVYGQQKIATT